MPQPDQHRHPDLAVIGRKVSSNMIRTISITSSAVATLYADCATAYPDEACGLLIGKDDSDTRLIVISRPMRNIADANERRYRFRLDPLEQLRIEREIEATGQAVLGFYHSHPDAPPVPSPTDAAEAWPFYSYLIVNVTAGQTGDMRSWTFDDAKKTFEEQRIDVLDK